MNYYSLLKKRGYYPFMVNRKVCVYLKRHLKNIGTIIIIKDVHCKGITMLYQIKQIVKDNGSNRSNFDKEYMEKEAQWILKKFNDSRQ